MKKATSSGPRMFSWCLVALGAAAWVACGGSSMSVHGGGGGTSAGAASGGTTTSAPTGASQGGSTGASTSGTGGITTVASAGTTGTSSGGVTSSGYGGTAGSRTTVPSGGATGTGGASTGTAAPVMGGPCSVEGQQSACATGDADPCTSCRGSWLYCSKGKWQTIYCDPPAPDAGRDLLADRAPDVITVAPDLAAPIDASVDGDGILRGHMVFAFELMAFEPCGTTNLIWTDLQGWEKGQELLPQLGPYCVTTDAGQAPCPAEYYVELTGTIAPPGQYGHMGKFSQQLSVGAFLAASTTDPADCPFLSPVYPN